MQGTHHTGRGPHRGGGLLQFCNSEVGSHPVSGILLKFFLHSSVCGRAHHEPETPTLLLPRLTLLAAQYRQGRVQ